MFTAKVYRIMVGSLSGAMEEVYVAKETIRKWNLQNAERTGKVFMPIEWDTKPEVIRNVDVVVAIVDNWVDNPELIENCIESCKQVALFFKSVYDPITTISGELNSVKSFRERVQTRSYCASYDRLTDFVELMNKLVNVF